METNEMNSRTSEKKPTRFRFACLVSIIFQHPIKFTYKQQQQASNNNNDFPFGWNLNKFKLVSNSYQHHQNSHFLSLSLCLLYEMCFNLFLFTVQLIIYVSSFVVLCMRASQCNASE